jgi:hypothetical protein
MDPSDTLAILWPLSVPAYVIVQIVVLLWASGFGRVAAALPLVVMIPVFVRSGIDLAQDSNLWFLLLFLTTPVALLYLVVVAFFVFVRPAAKHSPPAI